MPSPPPDKSLSIPFGTIHITEASKRFVANALDSGLVSCGTLVAEFERKFAEKYSVKEAVALSTGTDADALALAVAYDYGAKRGDEVIVPALSFVATGNAILQAGFKPVFVDVDSRSLNIDPSKIEEEISERTIAIMPVHLMGKPADMDPINQIAKRYKLLVVEDAAEAHGAEYKGRKAGSLADMGAFSTYVAHIISTIEGGIVTTDNPEYAEILRSLRSHGRSCTCKNCVMNAGETYCQKRFANDNIEDMRFVFKRIGFSSKMNEIEAAIGLGNMQDFDRILKIRHDNLLNGIEIIRGFNPYIYTIDEEKHERLGPHALPIIIGREAKFTRRELINHLSSYYIDSRTLFSSMPTQCGGFSYLGHRLGDFPNSEYVGINGIHIGTHQGITSKHLEYLHHVIDCFIRKYK